jgi:hypothetical protein
VLRILYESVEAVKEIFKTLVILLATFLVVPAFACSQKNSGGFTGGACSIAEINNLEKSKSLQVKVNFNQEKNLRPVRIVPEMQKIISDNCIFGICLEKKILGR